MDGFRLRQGFGGQVGGTRPRRPIFLFSNMLASVGKIEHDLQFCSEVIFSVIVVGYEAYRKPIQEKQGSASWHFY